MAGSPLLGGPRAGGVGLLVLLLLGLLRPPAALCARPLKDPRGLGEAGAGPRRFRRAARGEAAAAAQELARALAHLLEAERQERARAEAQEAEDQQARVLAQLLRAWGAPRSPEPAPGPDDDPDPDAPAAQLARALLRARLDPAALAAQLGPAARPRPPIYDDGPAGPEAEDDGDDASDVDPELLRYLLGRILSGSPDAEGGAAQRRRLRRAAAAAAADQDLGPEVPPDGVLGALLRVKRLDTPAPLARRLLPP